MTIDKSNNKALPCFRPVCGHFKPIRFKSGVKIIIQIIYRYSTAATYDGLEVLNIAKFLNSIEPINNSIIGEIFRL